MTKTVLTVSYLGTDFFGWQRQDNAVTVQETLESALFRLYGERVSATASGRTDRGVHAIGQVVSYLAPREIESEKIRMALNSFLPQSVRVNSVATASPDFDARKSAKRKTYEYRFKVAEKNPFDAGRVTFIDTSPDISLMHPAAKMTVGKHDFVQFRCLGSSAKTTERNVYDCSVTERDGLIVLSITADGFLYKMVRLIASAMLKVGLGSITVDDYKKALDGQETFNKVPLPPDGLYLVSVEYS